MNILIIESQRFKNSNLIFAEINEGFSFTTTILFILIVFISLAVYLIMCIQILNFSIFFNMDV